MITVYPSTDERFAALQFKFSEYYLDMIRSLEYRWWDPENKVWFIPVNELAELAEKVGRINVRLSDARLSRYLHDEKKAEEKQHYLKDIKPIRQHNWKTKPMPHQIEGFNRGIKSPFLLIADEPGLGKSLQAISIAEWRKSRELIAKCLIICGVNSTKYNWLSEVHKHSYEDAMVFDGANSKTKLKKIHEWLHNDILFGIINIESLRKQEIVEALNGYVDMIVLDEAHKAKSPNSKQGKALRNMESDYKLALTGTPMTNKPLDLWNILAWLGTEHMNYWAFRNKYCIMGGYDNKEIVGYKNLEELNSKLKFIMLRRKKEDVLDLPDKIYKTEYIELSKEQKKQYMLAKEGVLKQIMTPKQNINGQERRLNPLTLTLEMRQVTSGILVPAEKNEKLKRVLDILKEEIIPNDKKALIFTNWTTVSSTYRNALSKFEPAYITGDVSAEKRQREVDRFQNDPDCKVAIGTIGAMGTGLTMTAASYVFFLDKAWNNTDNIQAEDRAHRIGTKDNVTIISMVAKDTIDEKIEDKLIEKDMIFNAVVDGRMVSPEEEKDLLLSLIGVSEEERRAYESF